VSSCITVKSLDTLTYIYYFVNLDCFFTALSVLVPSLEGHLIVTHVVSYS
jgi:hypothetical protein